MIPIDSAVFYLYEKVKNDQNSTPNEIDAINALIQFVEDAKKPTLKQNTLFKKMYAIYFGILLDHYKDIDFAKNAIHKDLAEPTAVHIEFLRFKINNLEMNNYLKSIGASLKNHFELSKEDLLKEDAIIKENETEFLKAANKWSIEKITTAVENQSFEAINRFKHYE